MSASTPVELHSRVRVAELRDAVGREIDALRQQTRLPGQCGVIAWLQTSREALDEAERLLARAERELAKQERR